MSRTLRSLLVLGIIALAAVPASAQVATGTPAFGSFGGGPDVINLANLNAHIAIPVRHKPGRGTNFTYDLSYDTSVWYPSTATGTNTWTPATNFGWRGVTEVATGYVSSKAHTTTCPNPEYPPTPPPTIRSVYADTFVYHDTFGSPHPFNVTARSGMCGGGGETGTATDGSGYKITLDSNGDFGSLITSSSGTVITPAQTGAATVTDRNGNKISVSSAGVFTDTLGTTALTVTGTAPSNTTFTYTAPSGASASYTMKYTNYTVATNFGVSGVSEYKSSAAVPLVSSIVLPDGSQYTFQYEGTPGTCTPYSGTSCVTARLTQVTLPTGGTIKYAYSGGNNGILPDGSTATLNRTTPDSSTPWVYAQVKGTGAASTTTITDPQGNQTVAQFQGIYPTEQQVYQGSTSGTLLRQWITCYNGNTSSCNSTAITLPLTQQTVTDQFGTSGLQAKHNYVYNSAGGLAEQDDYDYGSGAPGALLKKTLVTFASLGNNITAFRQQVTVQNGAGTIVSQTSYNYDETAVVAPTNQPTPQHTSVTGSRGNLTSIGYPVSGLKAYYTNYDTGNPQTYKDVNGATTTFNYGALTATCGNAFQTSVTEPVLTVAPQMTWNCTGGVQLTATDENNQITTASYSDPYFWRPASIGSPDGGLTSWTYNSQTSLTTTTKMNASQNIVSTVLLDGLGRTSQAQLNSDPLGTDYTASTYDALGRPYQTYSPTRCSPPTTNCGESTWGYRTYGYDALSRGTSVTLQDGSVTSASYTNNTVTASDPAGKKRQGTFDGLGRLTQVTEDPTGLGYVTSYSFDALGDLTSVTQNGSRQRTYTYDALSRLTSEANPESGTVDYFYDASGHAGDLTSRIAPAPNQTGSAGVITTYTYDLLHRLTGKSYSDGTTPAAYYAYDQIAPWGWTIQNPIGRLTTLGTNNGTWISTEAFSYDPLGRRIVDEQCPPAGCETLNYTYNLGGYPTTYTNGVGVTFTQAFDAAGRVTGLTSSLVDSQHPATLATTDSSLGYYPYGGIRKIALGNGLTQTGAFNKNLQPCRINLNSTAAALATCADSIPSGNLQDYNYGFNVGSSDNGNVMTWTGTGQQSFNRTYSYDSLNRLAALSSPSDPNGCTGLSWTYDAWGNRTDQTVTGGSCPTFHQAVNTLNRLANSPYQYDAAGDLTADGSHTYFYDAEYRLIQVDGTAGQCSTATACYVYDAMGRRVHKSGNGISSPLDYVYDLGNNVVTELSDCPTCWFRGYVYLNGALLADYFGGTTYFVHEDHLGSTRLLTGMNQGIVQNLDYLPFGEHNSTDSGYSSHEFTGDEHDAETNLEQTWFRKYSSAQGRWTSSDPAGLAAVDPTNPQSWNRYAYVHNNPLVLTDALGLNPCGEPTISCTIDLNPIQPPSGGGAGGGGGHYAPLLDGSGGILNRTKTGNRCAGQLSQAGSVSNLSGGRVPEVLGSNFFGDVASLATGSGGLDQGAGVAADLTAHAAPGIASQVAVGSMPSVGMAISHTVGVYNPVTVGTTTITAGMTTAGKFLIGAAEGILTGKVLLDAGVYVGALVVCSVQ